jgi:hypothetical protein
MMTTFGLSGTALLWTPSGIRPGYFAIGTGSQAITNALSSLKTESGSRVAIENTDFTQAYEIGWDATFGPVVMSGCTLTEFGMSHASSAGATMWALEGFTGITFDGTNELKVDMTFSTGSIT